jgi:hypothetical protein
MSEWLLRGITAADEHGYDVRLGSGDAERTFRFTADEITIGTQRVLTFKAAEFEAETLYSRDSAKLVIQVVTAFHRARAEPVRLALPGEPPPR